MRLGAGASLVAFALVGCHGFEIANFTWTLPATSTAKKVVGYYEDWSATPSVNVLKHYTHVNYAFLEATSKKCTLSMPDQSKIDLFHSAGCKVIGSLGGASMNKYWKSCTVSALVSQLKSIVNNYGLDGVDIDYEVDPPKQSFVVELHQQLRIALPGKLLTHAPENNQMVKNGTYWNIIADVMDVDFISVQYYNDHPDPISDLSGSIDHYATIVNDLFGGDATKVVFGFCIADCGSFNVGKDKAASITKSVLAKFPNNFGGVMNWAMNQGDSDGSWSTAVVHAMNSGETPSPTTRSDISVLHL